MFPSDAVIGSAGPGGVKYVQSYKMIGYGVHNPKDVNQGWAGNMGLVSSSNSTILCFSRPLTTSSALATPSLSPSSLPIIWALSKGGDVKKHDFQGSLLLNVETGMSEVQEVGKLQRTSSAADLAHGVLMLVAFVVLMPGAVLLARHKWLFGSKKVSRGMGREPLVSSFTYTGSVMYVLDLLDSHGVLMFIDAQFTPDSDGVLMLVGFVGLTPAGDAQVALWEQGGELGDGQGALGFKGYVHWQ